jgi:hypothetical protein
MLKTCVDPSGSSLQMGQEMKIYFQFWIKLH